jgi:hypothetical protein
MIPIEMTERNRWVVWKLTPITDAKGKTRLTKCPYAPKDISAGTIDVYEPKNWSSYKDALASKDANKMSGVGYVLGDGLVGIDLDGCIQDGTLSFTAQTILTQVHSYAEVSPSGRGVKIFVAASSLDFHGNKNGFSNHNPGVDDLEGIEIYHTKYFTVTGNGVKGFESLQENTQAVQSLINQYHLNAKTKASEGLIARSHEPLGLEDFQLLKQMRKASNGDKFSKLFDQGEWKSCGYPSQSEADMALACILSWWLKNDAAKIDQYFSHSKLMRDKWNRDEYAASTIDNAWQNHWYGQDEPEKKPEINKEPVKESTDKRRAFPLSSMMQLPPPRWHIEGHFLEQDLVLLYAKAGSFKSFLVLDMALCVAHNKKYLDKWKVKPGTVLWITTEGKRSMGRRAGGWLKKYNKEIPENFYVIPFDFRLFDPTEAEKLAEIICTDIGTHPSLIVVDTLGTNFGGNQNDTEDMTAFIQNLKHIRDASKATIIVIHHTGKDEGKGPKSNNELQNQFDSMIALKRPKDPADSPYVSVHTEKIKDEPAMPAYTLKTEVIKMPSFSDDLSEDPKNMDTLVLNYDGETQKEVKAPSKNNPSRDQNVAKLFLSYIPNDHETSLTELNKMILAEGKTWNGETMRSYYKHARENEWIEEITIGTKGHPALFVLTDKGKNCISYYAGI